jgi:prepilin-type N-terminal cleavage/methylation domain-containing protein
MSTTARNITKAVRPAFTLVEIIISVTIFSLLIGVGVSSYLNLSTALKKQNLQRALYTELYRVLQDTERFGKFFTVDYAWYENNQIRISPESGNEELVLRSKDDRSRVHIKKITDEKNHSFLGTVALNQLLYNL